MDNKEEVDAGYGDTRLLSNAEMDAVWPLSFYMTRPKNLIKAQLAKCEPLIRAKTLKEVGELMIGRGTVGMEALPKWEQGFWKGYWQALIDKGESLQKGECLEDKARPVRYAYVGIR